MAGTSVAMGACVHPGSGCHRRKGRAVMAPLLAREEALTQVENVIAMILADMDSGGYRDRTGARRWLPASCVDSSRGQTERVAPGWADLQYLTCHRTHGLATQAYGQFA